MTFQLGDQRLNRRAELCMDKIKGHPGRSFPKLFRQSSELEAFYRLLHNPQVHLPDLEASLAADACRHLPAKGPVLVLHDTTHICPTSKFKSIEEFEKDRGFFAHLSLLVCPERRHNEIFGVGGVHMWTRSEVAPKTYAHEGQRWIEQSLAVQKRMGSVSAIHIMDREGDVSSIWSTLLEAKQRFVIRAKFNRPIKDEQSKSRRLFDELHRKTGALVLEREIELGQHSASPLPRSNKAHPARAKRKAHVVISARLFDIHKNNHFSRPTEQTLPINVVHVLEKVRGKSPRDQVEWVLLTSEPVKTEDDVLRVVDYYRQRWLIEEFFKGLKTGCHLEERLIADAEAWYRLSLLYMFVSVRILNLRLLHRSYRRCSRAAAWALSPLQREILKAQARTKDRCLKSHRDYVEELARLGGHIKSNGPPGWQTLLSGYLDLMLLELGWRLARKM